MNTAINKIEVAIILIPYNNSVKFQTRLEREIVPTIKAHSEWKFNVIIIDNSDEVNDINLNPLRAININPFYLRTGNNLMYGPAMNLALSLNLSPYIVYVCTNHGRMYHPTWVDDLLTPLINDGNIAMTGSHYPSCHPGSLGFPSHLPHIHIQGGVFASKTDLLLKYPYTNDERYKHGGSDIYQSFQLLNAGFILHDVSTIKSVWRQNISYPERWKYVHDYSE